MFRGKNVTLLYVFFDRHLKALVIQCARADKPPVNLADNDHVDTLCNRQQRRAFRWGIGLGERRRSATERERRLGLISDPAILVDEGRV